ncbi:cyd operon YbgE family protein [Hydrogenophaga taeniospiralis]|uniref:cyd operon YbgE family protein n=1 Tax=Hydrogenophaga taeniospiralis TaxID=65656 RepID=UPI001CFC262B|nr:cyd operon YbgE family protein [Hydrogenophaga taeniospiralis]UCU93957.1 cyd operon YbgE family protein [Hydrogenophaga taeniospiralis]
MTPAPTPASGPLSAAPEPVASRVHFPSLLAALAIMLVGSIYPLLFADASGQADHGLAMALFWAMSAGLVRGVGFVPRWVGWRWLFSGWACAAGLLLAAWLRWGV